MGEIKLHCPKCFQESGVLQQEVSAEDSDHLPEGIGKITMVQCDDPACRYEWQARTRSQTLQTLRDWVGNGPRILS